VLGQLEIVGLRADLKEEMVMGDVTEKGGVLLCSQYTSSQLAVDE